MDSVQFIMDTATKWIVLNDSSLIHNIKITTAKINDIGGKGIQIYSIGKFILPFKSDNVKFDNITNLDTVFVPSLP